ncbi:hypothetical protein [Pseudomonas sp. nanlin1]|uniref:hypothetical protein n=1 Tax=Pseudomonas sp. nanlin1 TaxID=3040605 RepID=UPI00388F3DA8
MHRVSLEIDPQLYRLLETAAQAGNLSVEQECLRRLDPREARSQYVQALLAELRADAEQVRAAAPH